MDQGISEAVDLFGLPVLVREATRGRPGHVRTDENAKRVSMLFAMNRSVAEVAVALGISQPTLRKHYFSEVQQREAMLDRLEADQLVKLFNQSASGSTAATKALLDRCDDARTARRLAAAHRENGAVKPEPVAKLGKKEAAEQAARNQVSIFTPPPAPHVMN
jgi:DNA invertase Pin-like site-specific DNA recombinase